MVTNDFVLTNTHYKLEKVTHYHTKYYWDEKLTLLLEMKDVQDVYDIEREY